MMNWSHRSRSIFTRCKVIILAGLLVMGTFSGAVAEEALLRMALLPIPDVLPVHVAQEKGYFDQAGITVETLPVGSAVERDQLMQAGRIDGMINEVGGAALFNREKPQMKIVSYARIPLKKAPLFRVVAAPGSTIDTIAELADVPVAISMNTVIEYITERMLQAGGIAKEDIQFRSVPVLPERLQLLLSGQIKAATLPEPLGFAALSAGAVEVVNDLTVTELSASVVSFGSETVKNKPETVKKFVAAWDKAVADINNNPESFRELMLKKIRVPKNVRASFQIPPFPPAAVPTEQQWDDVQKWLLDKELLSTPVSYSDSVITDFLP